MALIAATGSSTGRRTTSFYVADRSTTEGDGDQLHLQRSDASRRTEDATGSDISALVARVERAGAGLQTATEQLLTLARRCVERRPEIADDDETETEEELEDDELETVKVEGEEIGHNNTVTLDTGLHAEAVVELATTSSSEIDVTLEAADSGESGKVGDGSTAVELPPSVSSSVGADEVVENQSSSAPQKPEREESHLLSYRDVLLYALHGSDMMKKCGPPTTATADAVISQMDDQKLADWRQFVKSYAHRVNCRFLEHLCTKVVTKSDAQPYTRGTLLGVALLIHDKCEERHVLMQFVEYVSHVLDVAKGSLLEGVLSPLENCRDDLFKYCCGMFQGSLKELSSHVSLLERYGNMNSKWKGPFLISAVRKFIWDCTNYRLGQDVASKAPRTEAEWKCFHDIGVKLAVFMITVPSESIPFKGITASVSCERVRKFSEPFPGRIPDALLTVWGRLLGEGKEEVVTDSTQIQLRKAQWLSTRQTAIKRVYTSRSDGNSRESKRAMVSRSLTHVGEACVLGDDPMGLRPTKPVISTTAHQASAAGQYHQVLVFISTLKDAKPVIEKLAKLQDPNSGDASDGSGNLGAMEKCCSFVRAHFIPDAMAFLSSISSVDEAIAASFSDAATVAATVVTMSKKKTVKRPWVIELVMLLDEIQRALAQRQLTQAHSSVLEGRNTLLRFCDRFRDYQDEMPAYALNVEKKTQELVDMWSLNGNISSLAGKFGRACTFGMLRHQVPDIKPWTDEQWQKFIQAGRLLSDLTDVVFQASLPLPTWVDSWHETLEKFEARLPGRLPRRLLEFYLAKENVLAELQDDETKISSHKESEGAESIPTARVIPSKIKGFKPSEMKVVWRDTTREKITRYLAIAEKLHQLWSGASEDQNQKSPRVLQRLVAKAQEMSKLFLEYVARGENDENTNVAFGEATRMVAELICQCPREWISCESLKESLAQYSAILDASATTNHFIKITAPLSTGYLRLHDLLVKSQESPSALFSNTLSSSTHQAWLKLF